MKIAQQETAIAAYHQRVPKFASTQCDRVLDHITRRGPSTLSEIAAALRLPPGTISARATKLRAGGLLEWGPVRKSIASGVACKTLRLPARQLELC